MRVAYITAGAAGMYCGSCLSDNTLARALQQLGHEVALVPTYTPLRVDGDDVSVDQVFYGAVNVYLQQKSALFRHTPRLVDRLLDSPGLLDRVSKLSGSTRPEELGALTLSVLQGELGRQAKELARLVAWLETGFRPDLVHLTNSMFLGMARTIRERLRVPVVCSLQGEDLFLGGMVEPYKSEVLGELRSRVADVDRLTAPSRYYREHMAELLKVGPERIAVIPLGIGLDGHADASTTAAEASRPFTVGYLARLAPEKGFHLLVQAFRQLAEAEEPGAVRLRAAGYLGAADRAWFDEQVQRIEAAGLGTSFEHLGEVDRAGKLQFLSGIDVLAVPTEYREAKGRFALEAMASGVPVVVPAHGSFPEMIEETGGGVLVEPGSPEAVAGVLAKLKREPARRRELGHRGRTSVHAERGDRHMARATAALYEELLSSAG